MSRSLGNPGEEAIAQQDDRQSPHCSAGMNGDVKPEDASSIHSNENNEMAGDVSALADGDGTDSVELALAIPNTIPNTTPALEFPPFEFQET